MTTESAAQTHIGLKRGNNEDVFLAGEASNLFVVCDGMGGHEAGEVAARMTADEVNKRLARGGWIGRRDARPEAAARALERAILEAHGRVHRESGRRGLVPYMGTTVVAALVLDEVAIVASVGDSRAYLVTRDAHFQITRDHTLAEMYAQMGLIQREELGRHPLRNVLVNCIGSPQGCTADISIVPLEVGDRLLLCTDGLTEMVPQEEVMATVRAGGEPEAVAAALIGKALAGGGVDNVTVVVVERR